MCVAWQYIHLERKLRHMGPNPSPRQQPTLAPRMVVFNDSRQPKAPPQGNVDALSWSLTA